MVNTAIEWGMDVEDEEFRNNLLNNIHQNHNGVNINKIAFTAQRSKAAFNYLTKIAFDYARTKVYGTKKDGYILYINALSLTKKPEAVGVIFSLMEQAVDSNFKYGLFNFTIENIKSFGPKAHKSILFAAKSKHYLVRKMAAILIGDMKIKKGKRILLKMLKDRNHDVKREARASLKKLKRK